MFGERFVRVGMVAGFALMIGVGACVGSDPDVTTTPPADDGGSTPDGSSSGGPDSGNGDAGVDADLPPKAEGKFGWASSYSTAGLGAVVAPAADGVILATVFSGTATFDGVPLEANEAGVAPFDFAVMKLDATGKTGATAPRWIRRFSGNGFEGPSGIVTDTAGDVYVVGGSDSDDLSIDGTPFLSRPASGQWAFVLKLSGTDGAKKWARTFSSIGSTGCNDVSVSGANVAIGCTFFAQTLDFVSTSSTSATVTGLSPDRNAAFLLLDASDGKAKWANALGNANGNGASAVLVMPNGDVLAASTFGGAALADSAGSSLTPSQPKGTGATGYVARLAAADGKMVWVSTYGDVANGAAVVQVSDIAYADGHDIAIGGYYNGAASFGGPSAPPVAEDDPGSNGFVLTLDPANGATKWQKAFGGALLDEVTGVAVDRWGYVTAGVRYKSDGLVVDGATLPKPADLCTNAAALKWSPDGTQLLWNRILAATGQAKGARDGPAYVFLKNVVAHANGEITYGGAFDGSLDLGGGTPFTTTRENAFAVHTSP